MSSFDMQMFALMVVFILMISIIKAVIKEIVYPAMMVFLVLVMIWTDDLCSRNDRLNFYGNWFDRGGEIVCKDDNAQPILISQHNRWEHKGPYLFKGNHGIEILEDRCEILGQSEPRCIAIEVLISISLASLLGMVVWTYWKID